MTEKGFEACLQAVLNGECELNESFDPDGVRGVVTFKEAGVLTRNRGLVVTMDDGAEYQLTIARLAPGGEALGVALRPPPGELGEAHGHAVRYPPPAPR